LGVALERQSLRDQRRAEIVARVLGGRNFVVEADALIVAREQPEIITFAVVLLAEHLGQQRPFGGKPVEIGRRRVADDLLVILVLLDHDDDVVVHRQPGRAIPRPRRHAPHQRNEEQRKEWSQSVHRNVLLSSRSGRVV